MCALKIPFILQQWCVQSIAWSRIAILCIIFYVINLSAKYASETFLNLIIDYQHAIFITDKLLQLSSHSCMQESNFNLRQIAFRNFFFFFKSFNHRKLSLVSKFECLPLNFTSKRVFILSSIIWAPKSTSIFGSKFNKSTLMGSRSTSIKLPQVIKWWKSFPYFH